MLRVRAMAAVMVAGSAMAANIITGDARRGEQLFETQLCVRCHSFNGKGGALATDLSKGNARAYTPALMASLMWNHAPDMWSAMQKNGFAMPALTAGSAADLFAYFVTARYFERPGDPTRGKQVFAMRHCAIATGSLRQWQVAARRWRSGSRWPTLCCWYSRCGTTGPRCARHSPPGNSLGHG